MIYTLNNHSREQEFIYTYAYRPEEASLCQLEMRTMFGIESQLDIIKSTIEIDPSRSPFIKVRIEVMYEGNNLSDILEQVENIHLGETTFKVICIKMNDLEQSQRIDYQGRRQIERDIGWIINGEADVRQPDKIFGVTTLGGRWFFGEYRKNDAVWLHHLQKPREYSTALSTRVARAVSNIAVPNPEGIKVIDPCCGIGTVLVEALSMGIDIVGSDINPLVADGARENIAHFQFEAEVMLSDIADISKDYDVAIIDMPYNLATHATPEEQFHILKHARRFAKKVVIVTIETIDHMIEDAGFVIADRCEAKKGKFVRQVVVCS